MMIAKRQLESAESAISSNAKWALFIRKLEIIHFDDDCKNTPKNAIKDKDYWILFPQ